MRIAVGADHAGVGLKDQLAQSLRTQGHEIVDLGVSAGGKADYPDIAHELSSRVAAREVERGLLVCGTGVGMAMSANRHAGVRAVNCTDLYTAGMARSHNDANVLCLGARVVGDELAAALLESFLTTPFDGGRHEPRVGKIEVVDSVA